ncbi:MAG: hypothetical protein JXA30_03220 [Deltaproteobacteria bacterium]|nr:hypothetical protein [Deltaproteobacteria bacterium]
MGENNVSGAPLEVIDSQEVPTRHLFAAALLLFVLTFAPDVANSQATIQDCSSIDLVQGNPTAVNLRGGLGQREAFLAHFGFRPFPDNTAAALQAWTDDAWDFLQQFLGDDPSAWFLFYVDGETEWLMSEYFAYTYKYEYDQQHNLSEQSHFGLGVQRLSWASGPSFLKTPFDLFFLAPVGIIFVVPKPDLYYDLALALGARYRF